MKFRRRIDREGEVIIKEKFVIFPRYCEDTKLMHYLERLWMKKTLGNCSETNKTVWYCNGGYLLNNGGKDEIL